MVNDTFPALRGHGFELVHGDTLRRIAQRSIKEKFTPSSMIGAFCNFQRFNRTSNTFILSTNDSEGPDCDLNRSGGEGRGCKMFFLLRMAFWLGLVLVLLPRDKTPESDKGPQIGASEAVSAATAAVSDMSQFCKRQPAACEVGGQAATAIGERAKDGAKKLYQIITDKKPPDHTGSIGGNESTDQESAPVPPADTLTSDDLTAEWRPLAPAP
jgi:hypothetical protein